MQIRNATVADFSAIKILIAEFPDALMQDHLPQPTDFLVAEADGRIVGCCALEIYSKRLAEVRSLAVTKSHQGAGIASALVEKCIVRAKEESVYEVLTITGALPFFQKQGFGTFNNEKYAMLKILG